MNAIYLGTAANFNSLLLSMCEVSGGIVRWILDTWNVDEHFEF